MSTWVEQICKSHAHDRHCPCHGCKGESKSPYRVCSLLREKKLNDLNKLQLYHYDLGERKEQDPVKGSQRNKRCNCGRERAGGI